MIELHFWPSPNAYKVRLLLEETETPYRIVPVNVREGAQFSPEFLAISPNNRVPAIVDLAPGDDGAPVPAFESGAILIYLAEKTGRFLSTEPRARTIPKGRAYSTVSRQSFTRAGERKSHTPGVARRSPDA